MSDTDETKQAEQELDPGAVGKDDAEVDWRLEAAKYREIAKKWEQRAKANEDAARRLKEAEDAQKTDLERAREALAEAERRAKDAEVRATRLEVAVQKGLPARLLRFVAGETKEEIEESVSELLAVIKEASGTEAMPAKGEAVGKPRERLRPGSAPEAEPELDGKKLVELIPRRPA